MAKVNNRLAKEFRSLLECRHLLQADQCAICRGRTASGEMMEAVAERFQQAGHLVVELKEIARDGKSRSRRLKTLIGIGLGVTVFGGLMAWKGGKIFWRLIGRGKNAVKLLIAGMLTACPLFQ